MSAGVSLIAVFGSLLGAVGFMLMGRRGPRKVRSQEVIERAFENENHRMMRLDMEMQRLKDELYKNLKRRQMEETLPAELPPTPTPPSVPDPPTPRPKRISNYDGRIARSERP